MSRRVGLLCAVAVAAAMAGPHRIVAEDISFPADGLPAIRGFLDAHCVKCHASNAESQIRLDDMPLSLTTVADIERWQKVLGVINAGVMPPAEEPTPSPETKTEFLSLLSATLSAAKKTVADEGRVATMRRLNRREYRNTLRELLGVDADVSSLPDDKATGGFDTAGSALFMSSDQLEQYLVVGRRAATEAIDRWRREAEPPAARRTQRTEVELAARRQMGGLLSGYFLDGYRRGTAWKVAGGEPQDAKNFGFIDAEDAAFRIQAYEQHAPYIGLYLAMPKADEGAWLTYSTTNFHDTETISIPPEAPPGTYLLRLRVGYNEAVPVSRRFLEMGWIEGDEFHRIGVYQVVQTIHQPTVLEVPITITANGPRRFSFREKRHADVAGEHFWAAMDRATNGVGPDFAIWIDWVEWDGPIPDGSDSWRSDRLFGSRFPHDEKDIDIRQVLDRCATAAFRGVTPQPEYLDRVETVFQEKCAAGLTRAEALAEAISVILASPAFLYLDEPNGVGAADGMTIEHVTSADDRRLTDLEVAVRLSYFLWGSPPDDELLEAAKAGNLRSPDHVGRHVSRMVGDARSLELAKGFTHQWLDIDRLDFFRFDPQLYRDFDEATRDAAKQEIYRTFHLLMTDDEDVRLLLKADFVVVNGLLANYYGLQDLSEPNEAKPVTGDAFRKVVIPAGSPRGGLLGTAAVLAMGSNGERTSPVERGAWVLRKLVNAPPPDAPPNVPQLSRLDGQMISTRERLRAHQEQPQCAQCHRVIDPIGFGLENFDAAGRWRTEEHAYGFNWVVKGGPAGKVIAASFPIDPAGAFHNGPAFKDFFELRDQIAARGDDFLRGLIENLYAYGLGRPVSFADTDTIDGLVAQAKANGGGLASIIKSIVATPEFRTK